MKFFRNAIATTVAVMLLVSNAQAKTVSYVFEGLFSYYSDPTLISNFTSNGLIDGQTTSFTVKLDSSLQGSYVSSDGALHYLPSYEHFGNISDQNTYRGRAELTQSDIDFTNLVDQQPVYSGSYTSENAYYEDLSYSSPNSPDSFSSRVRVDNFSMGKEGEFGDYSVFATNWSKGDSIYVTATFNDGSVSLGAGGYFTITQVSPVPVPASIWLFSSALGGLVSSIRKGKRKQNLLALQGPNS